MTEVAQAMGDEEALCFACMKPFEIGQRLGPSRPNDFSSSVVHAECTGLPLQRVPTSEERKKVVVVFEEIKKRNGLN